MLWLLISGCCRDPISPILNEPYQRKAQVNDSISIAIDEIIIDSVLPVDELTVEVESDNEAVTVDHIGNTIVIESTTNASASISVEITDTCEAQSTLKFDVVFGAGTASETECANSLRYTPQSEVNGVSVAGDFTEWEPLSMTEDDNGTYYIDLLLEPGPYAYKFIEHSSTANQWVCDPNGQLYQCDEGVKWEPDCSIGIESCNSVVQISECDIPTIKIREIHQTDTELELTAEADPARVGAVSVTLNEDVIQDYTWQGGTLNLNITDLPIGRSRLMLSPVSPEGTVGEAVQIPIWNDDFSLTNATLYFAFVDRFSDGDPSINTPFGTNIETGDYMGGDWQGIINHLDHLESMGVNILWLTAPWDNADGSFEGDCGMTITGYHGYWPISNERLEPQFGDSATLKTLIDAAHEKHIRVLVDWVGNHVHEDHPYASEYPEWFTEYHLCTEDDNWNQAPETCWFAPYLPTVNYYQTASIHQMVENAIDFAKEYDIDGFRVDAVKHMPHAVHYNLQSRIENEFEHHAVGGSFEFYTVGETFSGDRELLSQYINPSMLDGQFEFGNYWSILAAYARVEIPLYEAENDIQEALSYFDNAPMSHFLGNHDVERFISHAAGEVGSLYGDGLCPTGDWRGPAVSPSYYEPYARLRLAWTYLLSLEGPALIYYGDEIGLPGYHDPDNRQMMYYTLSDDENGTLSHVQKLGQIRAEYPEVTHGSRTIWWGEPDPDVLGIARHSSHGEALILINRSWNERSINNQMSWAGLSESGLWTDVLNEESFTVANDELNITLAPMSSRILIKE